MLRMTVGCVAPYKKGATQLLDVLPPVITFDLAEKGSLFTHRFSSVICYLKQPRFYPRVTKLDCQVRMMVYSYRNNYRFSFQITTMQVSS
jgi:hypothetical protein